MTVNSYNIEFGYELISTLPYAYYLHSKGELSKTISAVDTECLYYFSPKHEINSEQRSWYNTSKAIKTPNIDIHKPFLNKDKFLAPPLKDQYKNKKFKFKKETIIICNRYNVEWGKKPINYFNIPTLKKIFKLLQDKYQIVYINIEGRKELYDNAPAIKFGDYELLKEYPKVINIHDLHKKNKKLSFNTLQLMLFANCEKYITMNGGHSILASYFGGENIIMSKYGNPQTREINPENNSFYRWYSEFGDQRIKHVSNETKLINAIKSQWVKKDPIVNILVRTSNRPNYFKNCMESILEQTYNNINIFVSIDNEKDKYTIKYPVYPVYVTKKENVKPVNKGLSYGVPFPANLYFNALINKVKSGLIIMIDDDDKLNDPTAISQIVDEYKKGNDLIFWRMKMGNRIVPNDINFKNGIPICRDISGIALAYDSKYKVKWTPYKRGDFRVADSLYKKTKKRAYINKILTAMQSNNAGEGKRNDIKKRDLGNDQWFITTDKGYWLGNEDLIKKKIATGYMKKIDIKDVPKHLTKNKAI